MEIHPSPMGRCPNPSSKSCVCAQLSITTLLLKSMPFKDQFGPRQVTRSIIRVTNPDCRLNPWVGASLGGNQSVSY